MFKLAGHFPSPRNKFEQERREVTEKARETKEKQHNRAGYFRWSKSSTRAKSPALRRGVELLALKLCIQVMTHRESA